MKVIVADRDSIEQGVLVRSSYVVISIHDPDMPRPKVRRQSGLKDVLCLAFHDAEPSHGQHLPDHIRLMTEAQAKKIVRFVAKHQHKVGAVVVHCEQGMSRSPAVAAAISRMLDIDGTHFFRDFQPNRHVCGLLCASFDGNNSGTKAGKK